MSIYFIVSMIYHHLKKQASIYYPVLSCSKCVHFPLCGYDPLTQTNFEKKCAVNVTSIIYTGSHGPKSMVMTS